MKSSSRCLHNSSFRPFLDTDPRSILGGLSINYHGDIQTMINEAFCCLDLSHSFLDLFNEETANSLVEKYRIETTKDGHAVFYQFDIRDRCRAGNIIPYDPRTGHRIKDGSVPAAMWVHSRLKALHQLPEDWTLSQCLFGEHLLPLCPELPIAMVEAGKTAVICSAVFPEFLWLATSGLGQFNDRMKVLLGRKVIAFPDLGAYDIWRKKAKDYPLLDITVSDYLEKNATPQQREMGVYMADWVVEERREEGDADRR